ncbi:MAG TPA: DUF5819 family protein [Gryllotalpicola sp.]
MALFLCWHFIATYAWNSAPNALRDVITPRALDAYMVPFFQQNWSVFAPDPVSANLSLDVRARVGADTKPTEWYTVTDADIRRGVLHELVPSRDYLDNFALVDGFYGAFRGLPQSAQSVVGADYTGAWVAQITAKLTGDGVTTQLAQSYSRYEQTAYRLASAVAGARWGDHVSAVQVRLRSMPVRAFEQRERGPSTTYSYFTDGWRTPLSVDDIDAGVIRRLYGGNAP